MTLAAGRGTDALLLRSVILQIQTECRNAHHLTFAMTMKDTILMETSQKISVMTLFAAKVRHVPVVSVPIVAHFMFVC